MRKKYDNLSKNRQEKQKEVEKLQAEHDKLTTQKNIFESNKKGGKDEVNQLYTNLSSMKLQVEEA
jgi:predicted  nucleic acid-binding Zn-ribbon protein